MTQQGTTTIRNLKLTVSKDKKVSDISDYFREQGITLEYDHPRTKKAHKAEVLDFDAAHDEKEKASAAYKYRNSILDYDSLFTDKAQVYSQIASVLYSASAQLSQIDKNDTISELNQGIEVNYTLAQRFEQMALDALNKSVR
jgi:hypothetical protein